MLDHGLGNLTCVATNTRGAQFNSAIKTAVFFLCWLFLIVTGLTL